VSPIQTDLSWIFLSHLLFNIGELKLHENFPTYQCLASSAIASSVETGVLHGRPFGGVVILVKYRHLLLTCLCCWAVYNRYWQLDHCECLSALCAVTLVHRKVLNMCCRRLWRLFRPVARRKLYVSVRNTRSHHLQFAGENDDKKKPNKIKARTNTASHKRRECRRRKKLKDRIVSLPCATYLINSILQ